MRSPCEPLYECSQQGEDRSGWRSPPFHRSPALGRRSGAGTRRCCSPQPQRICGCGGEGGTGGRNPSPPRDARLQRRPHQGAGAPCPPQLLHLPRQRVEDRAGERTVSPCQLLAFQQRQGQRARNRRAQEHRCAWRDGPRDEQGGRDPSPRCPPALPGSASAGAEHRGPPVPCHLSRERGRAGQRQRPPPPHGAPPRSPGGRPTAGHLLHAHNRRKHGESEENHRGRSPPARDRPPPLPQRPGSRACRLYSQEHHCQRGHEAQDPRSRRSRSPDRPHPLPLCGCAGGGACLALLLVLRHLDSAQTCRVWRHRSPRSVAHVSQR
mmetsp:Transcript_12098/g.42072  ORF Transcript_12098/g.42072 Transcript_12098/m.42072 type:complete len:323 (+) Transcript_12098:4193-5161(+)